MFEGFADTPDAKLWYWDTGGEGETIILCHPASQGCGIWEYQRDVFAQAGYRVIAYARRGHDRSEIGSSDDPGTLVGDLVNLLDCLKVERAHILGAAAGGLTATGFAVAHAERTLSLILAGTIFSLDEPDWRKFYGRLGIAAVRDAVSTAFIELGPAYRLSNPEGTERFTTLSTASKPGALPGQKRGVEVTWRALERMSTPTLLVTGEADLYAPPPLQAAIAERLSNHRLETIRAVGHAAYWEEPDIFNTIVLDFLNGVATEH